MTRVWTYFVRIVDIIISYISATSKNAKTVVVLQYIGPHLLFIVGFDRIRTKYCYNLSDKLTKIHSNKSFTSMCFWNETSADS